MDAIELLDQGYTWTAARIAAVPADGLGWADCLTRLAHAATSAR
jgi:hypothetical protein